MATTLFFRDLFPSIHGGQQYTAPLGTSKYWQPRALSAARGATKQSGAVASVAGGKPDFSVMWMSAPLAADVTISGTFQMNMWALESSMNANGGIAVQVGVFRGDTNVIDIIINSEQTVELGTAASLNSRTDTPTSTVCHRGDRIVAIPYVIGAGGTMASGFTFTFDYNGASGVDGDSSIVFTETMTFEDDTVDPTGSQIFPTDTASDVATAAVDREAWTSRGAGVQNDVTQQVNGPTNGWQITDTAGGTVVDWFTKQLQAFTLGGITKAIIRYLSSNATINASMRLEIAVVNSDGTGAVVWASGCVQPNVNAVDGNGKLTAGTEDQVVFRIAGDDVAVSNGQRLRIRLYLDDSALTSMSSGANITTFYAGASGATGDTFILLPQTVAEFVSGTPKSSSDANGTVTEATLLVITPAIEIGTATEVTGARAMQTSDSGSDSEIAGIRLSAADANGATTESAAIVVPVSSSDTNSATTENAVLVFAVTTSDTGSGSEASTLFARPNSSDVNGATTEAGNVTVPISSSDTNSATTESAAITVPISGSDANGATTEAFTLVAAISSVDTNGTTTESGSVNTQTFVNSSDSNGATTEVTTLVVPISSSDSNSITAEASAIKITVSDAGSDSETFTIVASISTSDANGTTTENSSTATFKNDTDVNGATTETTTIKNVSVTVDSGSSGEQNLLIALLTTTDTNSATTEVGSKTVAASSADSGTATEVTSLIAAMSALDTGSDSEQASLVARPISSDSGSDAELTSIIATLLSADVGHDSEAASINESLISTDNGTANELIGSLLAILVSGHAGKINEAVTVIRSTRVLEPFTTGRLALDQRGKIGQAKSGRVSSGSTGRIA